MSRLYYDQPLQTAPVATFQWPGKWNPAEYQRWILWFRLSAFHVSWQQWHAHALHGLGHAHGSLSSMCYSFSRPQNRFMLLEHWQKMSLTCSISDVYFFFSFLRNLFSHIRPLLAWAEIVGCKH